MITALMIVAGLSTTSTLVIVAGLLAAKRAQIPSFEGAEIAFSTEPAPTGHAATASAMTPAFSH